MPSPDEITVSQLSRLIGTPDAPIVVDVCIDDDFNGDPRLVPSSFRHPFADMEALVPILGSSRVVIVCHKGKKLSQGAAALLRSHGVRAESLQGGVTAWREAGEPLVPAGKIPILRSDRGSLWVTRLRPKIDRIACPWLIRRFVDRNARFLFVAPSDVLEVAEKFDATPFDIEGVFWSHRAERCTFDTMIAEFGLQTDALELLAQIVRGADTNRHDLAPEVAGLLAISVGLSRAYRNDLTQLDAGLQIYDAFYRWARDGIDETHDCPSFPTRNQGS